MNDLKEKLGIEDNAVDKEIDMSDVIEKEVEFDFNKYIESDTKTKPVTKAEQEKSADIKKAKPVDLSKISIMDRSPIDKEKDLKEVLYGRMSAVQIVAAQSGYMAKVIPLVHKDQISLIYSNLSAYEYKKTIFKVIYDKVVMFSVGSMTFEEWLKNTSVSDIETFYYGIYRATFPDGTYTFTCPDCGEYSIFKINPNNLLKTTDKKKMKELVTAVSKNAINKEAMETYSLINKTEGFELADSNIIMELRTPSLWDLLEIYRNVPETVIDRDEDSVTMMLYIKRFLIPYKTADGEINYTEQTDSQEVLRIIDNLSIDDSTRLKNSLYERENENRISYSVKNLTCPKCKKEIKDIPVSIEDILFTQIFETE